jgi:acetyl esterase/lipase
MLLRVGFLCALAVSIVLAQTSEAPPTPAPAPGRGAATAPPHDHNADILIKTLETQKWYTQLGDIAEVNEIRYTSAPPHHPLNPTGPGAKNPMIIRAMTFIPKNLDRTKKQPFIVFAHQGIHSDFGHDYEYGAVKELVQQGYSVIGPDYRGSTGYGGAFYNEIDYGGLEVDDVYAAREWMLENYSFLDPARVGMMGWSHGGFITLMNVLLRRCWYMGIPMTKTSTWSRSSGLLPH